jgi:DNA-binding transcriptional ArsR family regulator
MASERFNPWRRFTGVMVSDPVMASELSDGAKLTWGVLSRFAGRAGVCYPTVRTIAERLGKSERQTKRYLKELVDKGYIARERRDRRKSNRYYFLRRPEFAASELEGTNVSPLEGTNLAPEENHRSESHNRDLDSLLTHRQKRDARADETATEWPRLAALVEELLGCKPTKDGLGKIISATPTKRETEALEAIEDAKRRGYDASHKNGPHSMSWFVSVVQNYWADKLRRALPPRAAVPAPDPEVFDRMTAAIELVEEADDWPELEVLGQLKRTGDRK